MNSCRHCLLALVAGLLWTDAAADEHALFDRLQLRAGGYVTRFDTNLRHYQLDGGTEEIDFDRALGLDDRQLIESVAVNWRPSPRHELGIGWFNESLAGMRVLDRDIKFEDEVFPLATTVRSTMSLKAVDFHYSWWPVARERWAMGLRLGFVDYRLRMRIEMLLGEQGEPPDVQVEATLGSDIPALTFGLDTLYAPDERWRFRGSVGWFKADFEKVSPVILMGRVGAEYYPWDNIGLWADFGLHHMRADLYSSEFLTGVEIYEGGWRLGVVWRM